MTSFPNTMPMYRFVIPTLVLVLTLGLSACGSDEPSPRQDTPVVPVMTYRKAWSEGLACVTAHIERLGGTVVGRVVG